MTSCSRAARSVAHLPLREQEIETLSKDRCQAKQSSGQSPARTLMKRLTGGDGTLSHDRGSDVIISNWRRVLVAKDPSWNSMLKKSSLQLLGLSQPFEKNHQKRDICRSNP